MGRKETDTQEEGYLEKRTPHCWCRLPWEPGGRARVLNLPGSRGGSLPVWQWLWLPVAGLSHLKGPFR